MELITLNAKKIKLKHGLWKGLYQTEFFNQNGKHYVTIPPFTRQPRKDKKTIVLNCFKYKINWI